MWKREVENVGREWRNLKTGQHEHEREIAEGEMTADERITHERTGHAVFNPRCETCLGDTPRKLHTISAQMITEMRGADLIVFELI